MTTKVASRFSPTKFPHGSDDYKQFAQGAQPSSKASCWLLIAILLTFAVTLIGVMLVASCVAHLL